MMYIDRCLSGDDFYCCNIKDFIQTYLGINFNFMGHENSDGKNYSKHFVEKFLCRQILVNFSEQLHRSHNGLDGFYHFNVFFD